MIINFISWCFVHQLLQSIRNIWDRNCISHTFNLCRCKFRRVDSDYFTIHIQKCTTTVTRVNCCISLNQVYCIWIFWFFRTIRVQFTVLCTYNTCCYRLSISKSVTNGNYLLTYFKVIRTSHGCYLDLIHCIIRNIRQCYRNNCKVFVLIITIDGCLISLAINAGNRYGICSVYYMIVCCDQKAVIILSDDDTWTASFNFLLCCISLASAKSIISKIILNILNRFRCDRYYGFHSFCCDIRYIQASFCLAGIAFITAVGFILLVWFCLKKSCIFFVRRSSFYTAAVPSGQCIHTLKRTCCKSACQNCA